MDKLSPEILTIVFSYLDNASDVSKVRLCCTTFASVGIRYLVPTVSFVLLPESLARLTDISMHPVLKHYVKTVVGFTNLLPIYHKVKRYAEEAKVQGIPLSELRDGWACYRRLYSQQKELLKSTKDLTILKNALARFTNLKNVKTACFINDEFSHAPKHLSKIYSKCFISPRPEPYIDTDSNSSYGPPGVRHLRSLLAAITSASTKPESLSARDFDCTFFARQNWQFHTLKQSVENLRSMDLKVSSQLSQDDDDDDYLTAKEIFKNGSMRQFLSAAVNLKTLELQIALPMEDEPTEDESQYLADFDSIIGGNQFWPQLEKLRLHGINIQSDIFLKFLERHRQTLKDLSLESCDFEATEDNLDVLLADRFIVLRQIGRTTDLVNLTFANSVGMRSSQGQLYGTLQMYTGLKDVPISVGAALGLLVRQPALLDCAQGTGSMEQDIMDDLLRDVDYDKNCEDDEIDDYDCPLIVVRHPEHLTSLCRQASIRERPEL